MISRDSSGSVVNDAGVRYGGPWFELWSLLLLLLVLSIYQKGRHTQKAKPVQGVRLQKTNIHIHNYTYSTLQTKQYTTKHKTVIKKLLDT